MYPSFPYHRVTACMIVNIDLLSRQTQHCTSFIYFSAICFGRFIRPSSCKTASTLSEKYATQEVSSVAYFSGKVCYARCLFHSIIFGKICYARGLFHSIIFVKICYARGLFHSIIFVKLRYARSLFHTALFSGNIQMLCLYA
jgi:hypothetical protein